MKYWPLMLIMTVGCQDYNSNSADKKLYGNVELENNAQFRAAYGVLQNRCMNCHTHAQWAEYTTNAKWINSGGGRVIAGNPQTSKLISRIINSGNTDSNMPKDGSALPNDEYDILVQWIQNLP